MNKLLVLAAFLLPAAAFAQHDADTAAQRSRIAAERAKAESVFREREKSCYGKFGVNDCLKEARERRRAVIADLRRQEISLNDSERKRRGIERLRANEERERKDPADRAKAVEQQGERDARAKDKSTGRAERSAAEPGRVAKTQEAQRQRAAELAQARVQREKDAAENVARREKNEKEAEERKAALAKRMAERKKPAASALPTPP